MKISFFPVSQRKLKTFKVNNNFIILIIEKGIYKENKNDQIYSHDLVRFKKKMVTFYYFVYENYLGSLIILLL